MSKRKICIVTGSRAEYGLLYWLIKEVKADRDLQLQLIATGTHLSSEFGLTYKEISDKPELYLKEFKITTKNGKIRNLGEKSSINLYNYLFGIVAE